MEDLGPDSDEDEQEQRNPGSWHLASQITVRRPRPILTPVIPPQEDSDLEYSEAPETPGEEESGSGLRTWGIYSRTPSFTRMSPLSCRMPTTDVGG